ncbi:MAG: hypothetical protein HFF36_03655 [Coprobacillus sp.]|nr:hypothetical protein [Coprobacillus sp.]
MKIKKILLFFTMFCMLFNYGMPVYALESNFDSKNKESYQNFLVLKNKKDRSYDDVSQLNRLVQNQNIQPIKLFSFSSGDEAQISYNNTTNQYVYIESRDFDNSLFMQIEDEKYIISCEGENIIMLSEEGKKIMISEMIYENDDSVKGYHNINQPVASSSKVIKATSYGKEYGPYYKTNKSLVTVLSLLSTVTGLFSVKHPILGKVSITLGVAAIVGDTIYKTCYIKYWQALDNNKATNVKERQRWYDKPNYTNFLKERTIYFSSVRPGY